MVSRKKVVIVGSGYVGMSLSVLLAQDNEVVVLDIDADRVDKINNGQSTISDNEIEHFLINCALNLTATVDKSSAYESADFIVIATPTDYDPQTNRFDTASVDTVVEQALEYNESALVVIKSTVPVGHTQTLQKRFGSTRVIFSPEFLREGNALKDNLYPSRIIIGSHCFAGKSFANLLQQGAKKENIETFFVSSAEAEAVKLFANTYLAMRVSFFNELDSYALVNHLNTKSILQGVSSDPRIGEGYNNPSFGYGGYCLPKDTKQLLANYDQVPQTLIGAIVSSNSIRKDFIAAEILKSSPKTVGFYRLAMKAGSDNFRSSAIQGVIKRVVRSGVKIIVYEPLFKGESYSGGDINNDLAQFKELADVIVSNRDCADLEDIRWKVFSRDIFGID